MAQKQNDKKEIDGLSFEQTIESLTQIVDRIETGQVSLAESLEQYEKGMAMIKHCRGILLDAEKRIEQIAENEDTPDEDNGGDSDNLPF
ncbi:MAG: exodeoxyribonuclease VII small subunit [Planctomycetales bacterium 4572_13]|nr:MAG: exodeoxyribonuclease VII small subunit [Planctomycetales bacterium 4572_13]